VGVSLVGGARAGARASLPGPFGVLRQQISKPKPDEHEGPSITKYAPDPELSSRYPAADRRSGREFLMAVTGYRLCSFVPADMVLPIAGSMLHTTCQ
jgi:hypothetical protein